MSEAIAGAIGLGLNRIGGAIASHSQGYHALNQMALGHALNSAAMQQAHEHTLEQIGYRHGLERQGAREGYAHALDVIHQQGSVNRMNASHDNSLAMSMETHKANIANETRTAADESWKNRASFAITSQKQFAPSSTVRVHEHGLDFSTAPAPEMGSEAGSQLASKNRLNARMRAGRGRA